MNFLLPQYRKVIQLTQGVYLKNYIKYAHSILVFESYGYSKQEPV
jgi:hypothetical protein